MDILSKIKQEAEQSQVYKAENQVNDNMHYFSKFQVKNKLYNKLDIFLKTQLLQLIPTEQNKQLQELIDAYTDYERIRVLQKNIDQQRNNPKSPLMGIATLASFQDWCGAGTDIFKNIEEGKHKISDWEINNICLTHDIDYFNADTREDIEAADYYFITRITKKLFEPNIQIESIGDILDYTTRLLFNIGVNGYLIYKAIKSPIDLFNSILNTVPMRFNNQRVIVHETINREMRSARADLASIVNQPNFINNPNYDVNYRREMRRQLNTDEIRWTEPSMFQEMKNRVGTAIFDTALLSMFYNLNQETFYTMTSFVAMVQKSYTEILLNRLFGTPYLVEPRKDEYTEEDALKFLGAIQILINQERQQQGLNSIDLVTQFKEFTQIQLPEPSLTEFLNQTELINNTSTKSIERIEQNVTKIVETIPEIATLAKIGTLNTKNNLETITEQQPEKQEQITKTEQTENTDDLIDLYNFDIFDYTEDLFNE